MGNWTHLAKIGVRPAHGRAPVARTEQAHYAGVGGWFCPGCYDTAVAPTRCSTCDETMLPRGRALMVPRDSSEPSRVGVALRYVGVAVGVALVFSAPFVFGTVWGSRSYASQGHMLTALLVLLGLISTLVAWAWWSQSGGARRAGSATRWLERHRAVPVAGAKEGARVRLAGRLRVAGNEAWVEDDTGRARVRVGAETRAYHDTTELNALQDGEQVELFGTASVVMSDGTYRVSRPEVTIAPDVIVRR